MGLLTEGAPLSWPETRKYADHVRKHGIKQFLALYRKLENRKKDFLCWGDEVEYLIAKFDHENKKVRVCLCAPEVLGELVKKGEEKANHSQLSSWHPEYANYMVEGVPGKPYGGLLAHFNIVQANMALRRQEIQEVLGEDEVPLTVTTFPRLGTRDFTWPPSKPDPVGGVSRSLFFPDEVICQYHIRFKTLTRNIRERKGEKVAINVPIFKDKNTQSPFVEDLSVYGGDESSSKAALPDHIYMDAMGFGMGNCCLQVTFQACNIKEARILYDQLAGLCPIMLALSAASPIFRGYLGDIDTRWSVIAAAVDDRTKEERGLEPLKNDRFRIQKSRYGAISCYLSELGCCFNDIDITHDRELYQEMRDGGVDHLLAQHIAHLFIRDPVSLFQEKIDQDDENDSDHFENIQSTNWQSMRFKPPPPNSNIGWRVEFRPMEAQLTDFENAAFTVFIVLLTRVILSYKLNLIIPISKVDENMETAIKRDAVLNSKFYFKKDVLTESTPRECAQQCGSKSDCTEMSSESYTLMTVDEIFHGKDEFPGLMSLVNLYMDSMEIDVDTRCTVQQYLKLISLRASGKLQTSAHWMRNFVLRHPDYKQDSVVSDLVTYDLLWRIVQIERQEVEEPDLLFPHTDKSSKMVNAAVYQAEVFLNEKSPPSFQEASGSNSTSVPQCATADVLIRSSIES